MQPTEPNASRKAWELCDFISEAAFAVPIFRAGSAWVDHAPFAFWLMEALKPRVLVELGTHSGYSYFAFCEAVKKAGLETKCFAVDTWAGDDHAGFYSEEFFERVLDHNESRYAQFSRLVRSTFDEAAEHFQPGSVDLLHVDGRHFYEDAKHDFEVWKPKLSNRAVVLFHDTNVRERGFGVHRLWDELKQDYPSFEFIHGHGLGVLGYGRDLPETFVRWFKASAAPGAANALRTAYSRLGGALRADQVGGQRLDNITAHAKALAEEVQGMDKNLRAMTGLFEAARTEAANAGAYNKTLEAALDEVRDNQAASAKWSGDRISELEAALAAGHKSLAERDRSLVERDRSLAEYGATLSVLKNSTSWKVTAPLRGIGVCLRRISRAISRK